MWLKINKNYSPNFNPIKRPKKKIKFIIIHYTGMKKESLAIERLCDFNSNVSAHYFVKKNGDILGFSFNNIFNKSSLYKLPFIELKCLKGDEFCIS